MMKTVLLIGVLVMAAVPAVAQDAGYIGVTIEDRPDGGAIVRRIEPNSPADRAGLKEGDVILEFNKESVLGVQQLTRLVRETPVGRTIDLKIRRNNADQTLKVTTERVAAGFGRGTFQFNAPDLRVFADRVRSLPRFQMSTIYVQAGIQVESLTPQMHDFFGVSRDSGVLVTSVDQGSSAEKAGLKAGDVITSIDGKAIRNPADFSREMGPGSKPVLKVFRDKRERELRIE